MLVRDTTLASPDKILSDNLTHKPSASQSVWENFTSGVATPFNAVASFDEEFSKSPAGQDAFGLLETIKRGNENPEVGKAQWAANEVSNLIGQVLSPPNWALGGVGARLLRPVSTLAAKVAPEALTALFRTPLNKIMASPIAKYLPGVIGKKGEEQTLSMGLLGHEAAQGFGIGASVGLPQEVVNNFNAETGKHDFLGIAKGMGMDGMFGIALSPIPVAWGVLRANINRARGLPSSFHVEPGEAEPHISPEDHETWQAVDNHVQNPESRAEGREKATAAATQYLAKRGFPVDHAQERVNFEIMNRDQIDNLQAASVDQLLSDYVPEEHKTALTDFTVNAAVDDMSKNPEIFDGVRGYVDHIDRSLEKRGEILAHADALVDQHLEMIEHYHGSDLEHGVEYDVNKSFPDAEFGKGYWVSSSKNLSEKYNKTKIKVHNLSTARIYDVNNGSDIELNDIYRKISESYKEAPSTKLHLNDKEIEVLNENIKKFRKKLKEKGYIGVQRIEKFTDRAKKEKEVMLFEKPKPDHERLSMDQESLARIYHDHAEGNHLPFTVPKNVVKRVAQEKKIQALDEANERLFNRYEESGNHEHLDQMKANNEKINAIHEKLEPLKSARDELEGLRKSLIGDKGLNQNYERTPEYHRLEELADIWAPAKSLLDRINLERQMKEQQAYRDLAKTMLDIADGNLGKLADNEKVKGYLQARQAPQIETGNKPATMEAVKKSSNVPSDADTIIAEQDRAVEDKGGKSGQHDYEAAKDKFDEFKKSEGIFKNFISCVLGGQNG